MSLSLSRKTEKAFALWLDSTLGIDGLTVYQGHEKAAEMTFPALVVYAEGSAPQGDFPTECGVRVVRLRCKFIADSTVIERADLDGWKDALILAMTDDIETLQAALNKPTSGDDERAVQAIHFHHVSLSDEPSDTNETDWEEDCAFDVIAEPLDA
jgi:hypothetical protein